MKARANVRWREWVGGEKAQRKGCPHSSDSEQNLRNEPSSQTVFTPAHACFLFTV